MPAIPPFMLKKLYVKGSLRLEEGSLALDMTNPIAPGTILAFRGLEIDGQAVPLEGLTVAPGGEAARPATDISSEAPLSFPLNATFTLRVTGVPVEPGVRNLTISVVVQDVGPLDIPVADEVR